MVASLQKQHRNIRPLLFQQVHQHHALRLKTGSDASRSVLRELARNQFPSALNFEIQLTHDERILRAPCAAAQSPLPLLPVSLDAPPEERMHGPIAPDVRQRSPSPPR